MSPYTKDTPERPRKDQIQDPKNAGELNLSLTTLGLQYIKERGEKYVHYTHVINALSYNGVGGSFNHMNVPNGQMLKEKANYIIDHYRDTFPGGGDREEEILGTTKCAVMEFYWRMCRPYEDIKAKANGEVFPKLGVFSILIALVHHIKESNLTLQSEVDVFRKTVLVMQDEIKSLVNQQHAKKTGLFGKKKKRDRGEE